MTQYNIPDEYKVYIYPAVAIMLAGLVAFVVSIFFSNELVTYASLGSGVFGFFLYPYVVDEENCAIPFSIFPTYPSLSIL